MIEEVIYCKNCKKPMKVRRRIQDFCSDCLNFFEKIELPRDIGMGNRGYSYIEERDQYGDSNKQK